MPCRTPLSQGENMTFDLSWHTKRKHSVTGPELGLSNLMPITTPITLGRPSTALGKMIQAAITPSNRDVKTVGDLEVRQQCENGC